MLDLNKLIQNFEEIIGWPYVSPGSNDKNGIDCSGAFVRAYKLQGESIYHGSNRIIRVYCYDVRPVSSLEEIAIGEAVFKARSGLSGLSNSYKPGGQYYNPDLPYDFYHIGLKVPDGIIHATPPKAKLDKSIGNWGWAGKLKAVNYEGSEKPVEPIKATVTASSVNMRKTPGGEYMLQIPKDTIIRVTEQCTDSKKQYGKTTYKDYTGWIDMAFVSAGIAETEIPSTPNEKTTIPLSKELAQALYIALGKGLERG